MRRALALLVLAVFCLPAQDLPPGVLTLSRIRARVGQALDQLPDCTCVETVDRSWKPAGKEIKPVDRVVLQILLSGGQELFAAPGDTRWETDPSALLVGGMMGNGLFALVLKIIFLDNVSVIKYKGDESAAGRREARYDFSVSRMVSGTTIYNANGSGVVGMRGSFWADPETYDLRRLEYHAEEIPPDLLYADISTTIRYDRVRIGDRDVLLPQAADLRTTGVDGENKWNHIEFTHCQGFRTASTLRFGAADASPAAGPAAAPPQPVVEGALPPGLRITVALSAPLDDHAPVGSLIEGKVADSVMQKGKVLVPQGSLVQGRIRRLERYSDAGDYFILALEFMRIETPSASLRFYSDLQDVDRPRGVDMMLATTNVERSEFHWDTNNTYEKSTKIDHVLIRTQEVPGVGTFFVRGSHFSLPPGFKTVWKTQLYPRSAHP
ncbi:MAG: hypothetical protein ABSH40_07230 [Bryobacteraceae bacterium]|jgi:hypothetical protein